MIRKPKSGERIDQANIFQKIFFNDVQKELMAILVTPICDIKYKPNYVLCAVLPFKKFFEEHIKGKWKLTLDNYKNDDYKSNHKVTVDDELKRFIDGLLQGRDYRRHWLGELPGEEGYWYVDYNEGVFMKKGNLIEENRIAVVESPLRESIPVRFATFMSRIGLPGETPDREKFCDEIIQKYKSSK